MTVVSYRFLFNVNCTQTSPGIPFSAPGSNRVTRLVISIYEKSPQLHRLQGFVGVCKLVLLAESLLNGNGYCNGGAYHRVVAHSEEARHLHSFDTNPVCLPAFVVICPPAEFHFAIPAISVVARIEIHCGVAYLGEFLREI